MLAEEFNLICRCNCALKKKKKKKGKKKWREAVGGWLRHAEVGGVAVRATLKCNMHKK